MEGDRRGMGAGERRAQDGDATDPAAAEAHLKSAGAGGAAEVRGLEGDGAVGGSAQVVGRPLKHQAGRAVRGWKGDWAAGEDAAAVGCLMAASGRAGEHERQGEQGVRATKGRGAGSEGVQVHFHADGGPGIVRERDDDAVPALAVPPFLRVGGPGRVGVPAGREAGAGEALFEQEGSHMEKG